MDGRFLSRNDRVVPLRSFALISQFGWADGIRRHGQSFLQFSKRTHEDIRCIDHGGAGGEFAIADGEIGDSLTFHVGDPIADHDRVGLGMLLEDLSGDLGLSSVARCGGLLIKSEVVALVIKLQRHGMDFVNLEDFRSPRTDIDWGNTRPTVS